MISKSPSTNISPSIPAQPRPLDPGPPNDQINYSPELAEELGRIESEVQQELERERLLELQRQRELKRLRDVARFD